MLWGKLIDHDRCIGCHACSVACKSENEVPLGVFRTWVKQVEKGQGLAARRHFGVLRCNQCERAPCVAICPTRAMHRRDDGIVDFDSELCIGCKACIQACPYDAIYIDPATSTAAKCHFCAHRVDVGLQPACVAACPTEALVVSDLEDPASKVARTVAREAVAVRKPELGTRPKVFYKGADATVLDPRAAWRPSDGYWGASRPVDPEVQPDGGPTPGAPAAARVAYDVPREGAPWGGKISAYLLTKAVGAGALMVGGAALVFGAEGAFGLVPPLLAVVAFAVTAALLVADLKRPERFLLLLTRPQSGSWLVKGAYVLMAATVAAALWGSLLVTGAEVPRWGWTATGLLALVTGAAAAGYTALLLGQCQGRALWQSPLLLPHLVVEAVVAGGAGLALVLIAAGSASPLRVQALGLVLLGGLALNLLMILGELWTHANEDARAAVRWLTSDARSAALYLGVGVCGHVFPFVAIACALQFRALEGASAWGVGLASVGALAGVLIWDHLYVQAGQAPPLS